MKTIKLMEEIAKDSNITLIFKDFEGDEQNWGAYASQNTRTIAINKRKFKGKKVNSRLLSIFFHELGHFYCTSNNLWVNYHYRNGSIESNKKVRLLALKAEKWVDRWAEKQFNKFKPSNNMKFRGFYLECKNPSKWLKDNFLHHFPVN